MTVTVFCAVLAVALMVVAGLVVDGGAQLKAKQEASLVASEACRSGGQQIMPDSVTGQPVVIDVQAARQAAQTYIDLSASSSQTVAGSARIDGTALV